jgi:hypothetical protein
METHSLDFDYIPFDEVSEGFIEIRNLGKVSINYSMVGIDLENSENYLEPGRPVIFPPKRKIEAEKEETVMIKFLPGVPKKFDKKLLIQISHYAPEEIMISGEAGFADIMLDLPRLENDSYLDLFKEAQTIVKAKEENKNPSINALYQDIIFTFYYIFIHFFTFFSLIHIQNFSGWSKFVFLVIKTLKIFFLCFQNLQKISY